MIFTPGQFAQRAEFYHQLAQLTGAGIGVLRAVDQLQRSPPARSFREPLRQLSVELGGGNTFAESLRRIKGWLPEFDIALLQAGETSGRLDVCFDVLADYYEERARVTRQLIGDLLYPVFLMHFAIFILPLPKLFQGGNVPLYLATTFGVLLPIYTIVIGIIIACQGQHGERWRALVEKVLEPLPAIGKARRYMALSRLSGSLEALIGAGVTIIEAWELAARACGSPSIRRNVSTWRPELLGGVTPAEMVTASGIFPDTFEHLYSTGEQTGKLDDTLGKLRRLYLEEGTRKMRLATQWYPIFFYLIVATIIAYKIIRFWTDYFQSIQKILGM